MNLREIIRSIPDYPKQGIMFRDITPLLGNAEAFKQAISELAAPYKDQSIAKVVGIEARGFIIGAAVAYELGVGFVPLRKKGKLPYKTASVQYKLEYGADVLEMHADAVQPGERVLLVDDLIASGGTALAGVELLRNAGAEIVGAAFVIDLPGLGGTERLKAAGVPAMSLLEFAGH